MKMHCAVGTRRGSGGARRDGGAAACRRRRETADGDGEARVGVQRRWGRRGRSSAKAKPTATDTAKGNDAGAYANYATAGRGGVQLLIHRKRW